MTNKDNSLGTMRSRNEMVSLAERLGHLFVLRAAFVVMVPLATAFSPVVGMPSKLALIVTGSAYLTLLIGIEWARRLLGMRALFLIGVTLLIDGVYLAWVTYATGDAESPVRFLIYLHLIAVTLLASYRTGLKVALWHSLLLFVVFYAQLADLLQPLAIPNLPAKQAAASFNRASVFNVLAFWLVAMCTTAFSSLNERELRKRHVDLEALAEMASELEDGSEPDAIAETFLDKVVTTFGFSRGAVIAGRYGALELLAQRGGEDPGKPPEKLDSVVGRTWDDHSPVLVKHFDPETDPYFDALFPGARNVIVAPLFAEGRPLGAVVLEKPLIVGSRLEKRVVAMVTQFATHAALALRNAWLLAQVRKLAETDSLTEVANRRTFESRLRTEVARGGRKGEPVSLLMLDIDSFKPLNDTFGHVMGDEVLCRTAEVLVEHCRPYDLVARYGGDEFAVVLPGCSARDAVVLADRIRKAVSRIKLPAEVTASLGVATLPTNAATEDELVKAADEALYESKRSGRDRVARSRRRGKRQVPEESVEQQLTR